MTSVNSPACLLARNHFYRNVSPSPEPIKPVFSSQSDSTLFKERQVTVLVTMSTPPGFPGGATKGLWVSVVLGSPSPRPSPAKRPSPADQGVK